MLVNEFNSTSTRTSYFHTCIRKTLTLRLGLGTPACKPYNMILGNMQLMYLWCITPPPPPFALPLYRYNYTWTWNCPTKVPCYHFSALSWMACVEHNLHMGTTCDRGTRTQYSPQLQPGTEITREVTSNEMQNFFL